MTGSPPEHAPLVEWEDVGQRVLRTSAATALAAVAAWVLWSLVAGDWSVPRLRNLFGLVVLVVFLVELWVVGGSALRGMLRAGERGERLSGRDVGLLPPQMRAGGSFTPGPLQDPREGPSAVPGDGEDPT